MRFYPIALLLVATKTVLAADASSSSNSTQQVSKPEHLPDISWNILDMDLPARENLCQRQMAYCANNCGGPKEAPKNFCNATSMAWGCGCANKTPDFAPYMWPIVIGECSGQAQACQTFCNEMKTTQERPDCSNACTAYYQCGSDKAPPSYLETNSASDEPSYDGKIKAQDNNEKDKTNSDKQQQSSTSRINQSSTTNLVLPFVMTALLILSQRQPSAWR